MEDTNNNNIPNRFEGEAEKPAKENNLTLRRKRIITITSIVITVALIVWFTCIVIDSINQAGGIELVASQLSDKINQTGYFGVLIALGIQILQVIVSPIPGQVIEITMGICYGSIGGALLCLLGSAIGAALIMILVKKFGIKIVELFISTEQINNMRFINSEKKLERLAFILFVLPGTPKDPLIFLFGLTKMKTSTFVFIQTIARAPAMFATTLGGKFLADGRFEIAILIFILTGICAAISMIFYNKVMSKIKERKENPKEQKDI